MTDINTLIKQFVNSKRHSRAERKAVYELACMAADLYHENIRNLNLKEDNRCLREQITWLEFQLSEKCRWTYPANFNMALQEESRMDG